MGKGNMVLTVSGFVLALTQGAMQVKDFVLCRFVECL